MEGDKLNHKNREKLIRIINRYGSVAKFSHAWRLSPATIENWLYGKRKIAPNRQGAAMIRAIHELIAVRMELAALKSEMEASPDAAFQKK
jgi:hypothetical protein